VRIKSMQKSPPLGGERQLLEAERREGRRDAFHSNRFSVLTDMDSEEIVTADKYGEEEADSMKRGEFRDRSSLGQRQRDTPGRRKKREEESVRKREKSGKMEVEEGEAIDTDVEKSREECTGTQKPMAAEYNAPIRETPGNKGEERSESSRKKEDVAQNIRETNIERNKKKGKELNREFLMQGGILKSIEELDTSEILWKKDKFDEGQKGLVKVKVSTGKVKVAKGRNLIVIMQSLRLLKVQYEQINMINHRAAEVSFRNVNDANCFLTQWNRIKKQD